MLKKRLLSALLCLCMMVGMLPVTTQTAQASTNGYTQEDAVAWVRSKIGTANDYDGIWGAQCVDLANWYIRTLGHRLGPIEYAYNLYRYPVTHPSMDLSSWGWRRYTNAQTTPQPGDIVVFDAYCFGAYDAGHVGIVTDVAAQSYTFVDYNGCGGNYLGYACPGGRTHGAWNVPCCGGYGAYRTKNLNEFSCVIRPDWPSSQPTAPSQRLEYPSGSLADNFYARIYNPYSRTYLENRNGNVQTANDDLFDPRQIWQFVHDVSKGSYRIINMYDGRCLDAHDFGTVNGTNVQVHDDNGSNAQRWWLCGPSWELVGDNPFYFVPIYVGSHRLVMEVTGGDQLTYAGTNIQLFHNHYLDTGKHHIAQTFNIQNMLYNKPSAPTAPANIWVSTESGRTILLWDRVPESGRYDSRAYDVRIRNAVTGSVLTSGRTTDTTFTYGESLTSGNWIAEVRAVNTKYASNCNNYASAYASQSFSTSPACTLTLIASPEEGGTVNGGGQYDYGDYTTIQATPNKGYHFVRWEWPNGDWAEGLDVGVNVTEDVTITAVFKKDTPDEPNDPDTPDASGTCGEGVFWKYDKKNCVLTISGNGRMDDYSYRYDEEHAPWYDFLLTGSNVQIIIEDGVQNIGDDAFFGFDYDNPFAESNVASVSIGKNVTEIGDGAFRDLALTDVVIPDGVTSLGESAFSGCNKLVSVKLPESLTHIGAGAFNECINLLDVTIPNGITVIEPLTFCSCGKINTINIPSSVTRIEDNAFSGSGLTNIFIPASVTDIGKARLGFIFLLSMVGML